MNLEHYPAHIAEHATEHRDTDACRKLWHAVLELAAKDLSYLQNIDGAQCLPKHRVEKARNILDYPPAEFIESCWFDAVCELLGLNGHQVRDGLRDRVGTIRAVEVPAAERGRKRVPAWEMAS